MESEVWRRYQRRRFSRRGVLGGGAALGAGALLAACSSSNNNNSSSANSGSKSAATAAGSAPAGTAAAGAATRAATAAASVATRAATAAGGAPAGSPAAAAVQPRGTLMMALVTLGDQSSDPHKQNAGNNLPIINSCFEQFSRVALDGKLVPALASSVEEAPDHTQFTFKLRPDAKFWDGTAVTADDAVWSYQRWVSQKPPDSYATQAIATIDSVTSPDPATVVVKFKAPTTLRMRWAGAFAPQGWNIASKAYHDKVGEDAFSKIPMATGPYKVTANEAQAFVDLEAIPNHYELRPQIAKIHMDLVPEQATRIARLQTGEAGFADGVLGPQIATLDSDSKLQLYQSEATAKATLYFHSPDMAPYNDVRFRKALGLLIDQASIIKTLFQTKGSPAPQAHIFTIADCYDKNVIPNQAYSPDDARKLLKDAGLDGGVKIKMNGYDSSSVQLIPDSMTAVANLWKKEKIEAETTQTEAGAYFEKYRAKTLGDIAVLGSGATNLGESLLLTFYASPTGYGAPVPMDLQNDIKALSQEFDAAKQIAKEQAIYKRIIDEAWSITFPYSNSVWAARKDKLKSWQVLPGNAYPATFYTMVPA